MAKKAKRELPRSPTAVAMRRRHGSTTRHMLRRNRKRAKDARNDPVRRACEEG